MQCAGNACLSESPPHTVRFRMDDRFLSRAGQLLAAGADAGPVSWLVGSPRAYLCTAARARPVGIAPTGRAPAPRAPNEICTAHRRARGHTHPLLPRLRSL